MFTKRQYQILAVLSGTDSWISSLALSEAIGIGKRTIQTEIRKINEEICRRKLPADVRIRSNNRKGYFLADPAGVLREILYRETQMDNSEDDKLVHSRRILALLLFEKDYIHIGDIANRLYFSKSTVNSDLVQIKRIINRTKGAELEVSMSKGIRLVASEDMKRFMCMKARLEDRRLLMEQEELKWAFRKIEVIGKRVGEIFVRNQYIVSGDVCLDFVKFLVIGVARSRMGFVASMPECIMEISEIAEEIEVVIREEMDYELTEAELQYTEGRIRELNLLQKALNVEKSVNDGIGRFERMVLEEIGLDLQLEERWKTAAGNHMERMILRLESGRTNLGNYTKELSRSYPLELHLLRVCLCAAFDLDIPDAELGYMIPYLAEVIGRRREKPQILLVSDSSASVIFHLISRIKNGLGDRIGEICTVPRYVYERKREEYWKPNQLCLTTEHDQLLAETGFFYINPFAEQNLIRELSKKAEEACRDREKEREKVLQGCCMVENKVYLLDTKEESPESLLELCGVSLKDKSFSMQSIDNNVLCIISHNKSGENCLKKIPLKHTLPYKGKQINVVIYVHYGGEGDVIEFFYFLKKRLARI